MVLDIILNKSDDGFTAEVPAINGCECWAAKEDDAVDKIVELAAFYLKIKDLKKLKLDKARVSGNKQYYKLVFNKE
ncbi:MAG TPA: hypothetical protein PK397_10740 [Ignavibacteriaceae bacterium]|nr:hypothetical protein [Ignavibacteriaceae bacterium]